MEIVLMIGNIFLFLTFLIGLLWSMIGPIIFIVKIIAKDKITAKLLLISFGGTLLLLVTLALWLILNIVATLAKG